ncbi:MAG: hypothetical protein OEZ01_08235 [Candidatus Heimdallarchaeota archaeon]|nr:hypothetical protein [Candidatus Heimdallarchaeota archaeon]
MYRYIFLLIAFLLPEILLADGIEIPSFAKSSGAKSDVNSIVEGIAVIIYVFAGAIAFLGIIKGGMKIMDDNAEEGFKTIKNVVIGGGVVAVAGAIVHALA